MHVFLDRPECSRARGSLFVLERRREPLAVDVRKLDELHADVETRRGVGGKRLCPNHLDAAGERATVGKEQFQLQAIARGVPVVGVEAHAPFADVERFAPAKEQLASRAAEKGGVQAREFPTVVSHAVEPS